MNNNTVRVLYSEMSPKERLEFLRDGVYDEKYVLHNPVNYHPVGYTSEKEDTKETVE